MTEAFTNSRLDSHTKRQTVRYCCGCGKLLPGVSVPPLELKTANPAQKSHSGSCNRCTR